MTAGHGDHTELWDYIKGHGGEIHELTQRVHALEDKLARLEECTERELRALWAETVTA